MGKGTSSRVAAWGVAATPTATTGGGKGNGTSGGLGFGSGRLNTKNI